MSDIKGRQVKTLSDVRVKLLDDGAPEESFEARFAKLNAMTAPPAAQA